MGLSLKPDHLKRYGGVARLLFKYGRGDIVVQAGLEAALDDPVRDEAGGDGRDEPRAVELATDLEALGPTYVKLGQLLSTRADLLPLPYLEALARLQDEVEPFEAAEVERIVQEELGVRIGKAFTEFELEPMAAASLGQVHRARLRNGRAVAVKVQRPDIRERVVKDLAALEELAEFIDGRTEWGRQVHTADLLDEFRKTLFEELDYRKEAANLVRIGDNLKNIPLIVVPQPVDDYTTTRVLTMDYVAGRKVTAIGPLGRLEMDGRPLADALFEAYLKQILVDGLFHADPHPGNVFVTDDGRIALLDLGMVARVSPEMREQLLKLLLAVSEGHGEEAADIAMRIGDVDPARVDEAEFRRQANELIGRYHGATVEDIEIGTVVMKISRTAAGNGVRVPRELTMIGKALLNLDAVGRALDPDFDPNAAIRAKAAEVTSQRMRESASPGNILSSVLESAEFIQKLPARVNRILDAAAKNELGFKVDTIDERTLVDGFQKVANRITMGLILAALIVGAAMLMRVETEFTILGYPGLAILCFLGAVAGGMALMAAILLHDERSPPKEPKR